MATSQNQDELLRRIIAVLVGHLGSGRCWTSDDDLQEALIELLKIHKDSRDGGIWVDTTIRVVDSPVPNGED